MLGRHIATIALLACMEAALALAESPEIPTPECVLACLRGSKELPPEGAAKPSMRPSRPRVHPPATNPHPIASRPLGTSFTRRRRSMTHAWPTLRTTTL